jgi:pimeloyl-ACP methyl ester carboxylesterase
LSQKYNLIRYTIEPNGGHFASLEEPAAFLKDLRGFIQDLKTIQNKNEL